MIKKYDTGSRKLVFVNNVCCFCSCAAPQWKVVLLMISASVVLQLTEAQSGAESLSFHGYIPRENVRAKAPRGDGQPNDIYLESPPTLKDGQVVFYPRNINGLDLEYGQDPEERVYQIHDTNKLQHDKVKRAATVVDIFVHQNPSLQQ
nr:uncharacterized protein LOC128693861 [Cherax quadricarinatus]